jgi:mono/diheme cytochrome c family protein
MKTIATILGFSLLVIASEAAFSAAQPDGDAQGLFEQKCSTCHSASRATSQKKTPREWERTVLRMKNANGAPISDQEAKTIIDYLSKNHGV